MIVWGLLIAALLLSLLPAATFLANRPLFQIVLDDPKEAANVEVSILVPARNEELGIVQSVSAALASEDVVCEVVVLDDHSTDDTRRLVESLAADDPRLRLLSSEPLPEGWNGKQHACFQLAKAARHERLVFIDADVRLEPKAISQLVQYQDERNIELLSAFPRQVTETFWEKLIIPMMHYILLGYLPMQRMRQFSSPAYAAGCGQLFMTSQEDYLRAGTHAAIKSSRHDGVKLPRAYREKDMMADVVDGTDLALCRMYSNAGEVFVGVLKNATEGIAAPKLIVPFSILLLGGSVLPILMLAVGVSVAKPWVVGLSLSAVVAGHLPRALAARDYKQPWVGVVLHAPAVAVFVLLQWLALAMKVTGRQVGWRGRRS